MANDPMRDAMSDRIGPRLEAIERRLEEIEALLREARLREIERRLAERMSA